MAGDGLDGVGLRSYMRGMGKEQRDGASYGGASYDGPRHEGEGRSSPYGLSRLAPAISLVDTAREIEVADAAIGNAVSGKLKLIADQIRYLQDEARKIVDGARQDLELHRAKCGFVRRIGHIYHLYAKDEGALYWSMLSPADWGSAAPHEYKGSFRLEADQSWTSADTIDERDADPTVLDPNGVIANLLGSGENGTR